MDKIRVDASELTLGEMAEVGELVGENDTEKPGVGFRYTAAMAYVTKRRSDPNFTYDDALNLKMSELDMVESPPEASGAGNGAAPQPSPAPGDSTPPT